MNPIIDQLLSGIPRGEIKEVVLVRNGRDRITFRLDCPKESTVDPRCCAAGQCERKDDEVGNMD